MNITIKNIIGSVVIIIMAVVLLFLYRGKKRNYLDVNCVFEKEIGSCRFVRTVIHSEMALVRLLESLEISHVENSQFDFDNNCYCVVTNHKIKKLYYTIEDDQYAIDQGNHVINIIFSKDSCNKLLIYELPKNFVSWDQTLMKYPADKFEK